MSVRAKRVERHVKTKLVVREKIQHLKVFMKFNFLYEMNRNNFCKLYVLNLFYLQTVKKKMFEGKNQDCLEFKLNNY